MTNSFQKEEKNHRNQVKSEKNRLRNGLYQFILVNFLIWWHGPNCQSSLDISLYVVYWHLFLNYKLIIILLSFVRCTYTNIVYFFVKLSITKYSSKQALVQFNSSCKFLSFIILPILVMFLLSNMYLFLNFYITISNIIYIFCFLQCPT